MKKIFFTLFISLITCLCFSQNTENYNITSVNEKNTYGNLSVTFENNTPTSLLFTFEVKDKTINYITNKVSFGDFMSDSYTYYTKNFKIVFYLYEIKIYNINNNKLVYDLKSDTKNLLIH